MRHLLKRLRLAEIQGACPREWALDDFGDASRPRAHNDDLGGQIHRLRNGMRHKDNRFAGAVPKLKKLLIEVISDDFVQRAEWLIHEEKVRVKGQRPGDGGPLLHPSRKLPGILVFEPAEIDELQSPRDALRLFGAGIAHDFKRKTDVAADCPPRVQTRLLEHIAIGAASPREIRRNTVDGEFAVGGRLERRHAPQKRRFSAAGWPDEGHELPFCDDEVDIAQGVNGAIIRRKGEVQTGCGHDRCSRVGRQVVVGSGAHAQDASTEERGLQGTDQRNPSPPSAKIANDETKARGLGTAERRAMDQHGTQGAKHGGANLAIDGDRLWESLMEMAKIGPGVAGGNNRQTLTDEDAEARRVFQTWCEDAGCEMGLDRMGNMFATRAGTHPDALPVYLGSHLDTQPTGGKYDGVLGVLGGLELFRTLNDAGIRTRRPLVLVNFSNEEGTRFAPAMLASGVFAGIHDENWAYDREDVDGKRFGEELSRIGWRGEEVTGARQMHAFFELHIEQGPILEADAKDIGIVTHGQGLRWIEVKIIGRAAHTGSTPMPMRRNAGLGMARIVDAVDDIAQSHAPHAVGAAGHIDVAPNSRNVIPGQVTMTVDFRSPDLAVLEDMVAELARRGSEICANLDLEVRFERTGGFDPVTFDADCVATVRDAADALGYAHRDIVSGAGHDACWINRVAPTAMIMCPCIDGLSHNEAEEITKEWSTAGANVLLHAVLKAAGIMA